MKVVLQDGIKDCGICCLLSIIRFYGGEVSKEYLRELTNTTKEGVSLYNLVEAAKKIGFDAMGVTGKLENIEVNNLPCIAHFTVNKSYKHFVVLYEINEKKQQVTLMDPAKGKKNISFAEFHLLSSNYYLFLKPIKKLPIINRKNVIYKKIKQIIPENKILLISIIILTFSYLILNVICTFHFKYILELSINYDISNPIIWISILMAIFYLLKSLNSFFRNILLNKWTSVFDYETTSLTYKQILLLPYLYYKNRTTGEVVSRFKDLNTIRSFISNFFCTITTDVISLFLFTIIMYEYSHSLTKYLLWISIGFLLYSTILTNPKKRFMKSISNSEDIIHSYLINGISNVDTVKGSHLEKRLIDKFSHNYHSFLEKIYHYNRFFEEYFFVKNNVNDLIFTLIYGLGSYYVIEGKLSLENLILYQTFYAYFRNCFDHIISLVEDYSPYKVALDRVEELFMITTENFQNSYFYLPYKLEGDIIFSDLNYRMGSKVLYNHLNLKIKQGEKILLSGASGSGKSTLLKMLLRYIDIEYKKISINNIDINHYHLENIRSHITYVSSNEYLFTDTIRNNILLYKEVEEEKLEEVCKICLVDDILKNSMMAYDTLVEENGFNFSQGEKQRIILARSIIRNSDIYIFDEALAGIDVEREKKILKNIFEYLEKKTVIVISHRFNNKKVFDRVLKLEGGEIHENS